MKKQLFYSTLLAIGLLALAGNSAQASNLAADNSSFYTTATWLNGSNQGVGFAP